MKTNYLVLEKGTYKILDSAKSYCKRVRNYCSEGKHLVFYIPSIQGTHAIKEINKINNTNY